MDNTSEARRKKIMRRKRAMLKRTHRRINVTFIIAVSYTHLTLPTIA